MTSSRADSLRRLIRITLLLYWCVLLTATHLPPRHMPHVEVNDKFEHLTAYTLLAILIGLSWGGKRSTKFVILRTIVIVMCAGAIDEWTQPIFGRDCELNDWFADTAGAAVGTCVAIGIRKVFGFGRLSDQA